MTTSTYTLLDIPNPSQYLVHVHPSGSELGSVYRADLPINATAETFARALDGLGKPAATPWSGLRKELRASYEESLKPLAGARTWVLPNPSGLNASWTLPRLAEAYRALRS